jgi:hypothetical protein
MLTVDICQFYQFSESVEEQAYNDVYVICHLSNTIDEMLNNNPDLYIVPLYKILCGSPLF